MFWVVLLLTFVKTESADSANNTLSKEIFEYFDSELVYYMRNEWGAYREGFEHSIAQALQETMGTSGLNVFSTMTNMRLTDIYYHNHGQVQIVFSDMDLMNLPKCWLPQVSLSLASNVLKFEVPLTKMIITADYVLIRNKSEIITNINQQDYFQISPFMFHQVPNLGKVAFSVDGCILSGYVMTTLKGESINLGHDKISLNKCRFTMEIYKDGSGHPPIISEFSTTKTTVSLEIKHFLLRPIKEEFISKLQGALFSIVNTTVIYGQQLPAVREAQEKINLKCAHGLNKILRGLNEKVMNTDKDVAKIDNFVVSWNDTPTYMNKPERVQLSNMVLTGLGTAYNLHTGGPYKMDNVMIGERIGYSTLQVRGIVSHTSEEEDHYKFSVEISDFAINVDIDVKDMGTYTEGDLVGFRKIEFAMPDIINNPVAKFITGYVIHEIPKIVIKAMSVNLDTKLMHSEEVIESDSNRRKSSAPLEREFNEDSYEEVPIVESRRYLKNQTSINVGENRRKHPKKIDSFTSSNDILKD